MAMIDRPSRQARWADMFCSLGDIQLRVWRCWEMQRKRLESRRENGMDGKEGGGDGEEMRTLRKAKNARGEEIGLETRERGGSILCSY